MTTLALVQADRICQELLDYEGFRTHGALPAWLPCLIAAISFMEVFVGRAEVHYRRQFFLLRAFWRELHGQLTHFVGSATHRYLPFMLEYEVSDALRQVAQQEDLAVMTEMDDLLHALRGWYPLQSQGVRDSIMRQLGAIVNTLDLGTDYPNVGVLTRMLRNLTEVYNVFDHLERVNFPRQAPPAAAEPAADEDLEEIDGQILQR
eukprot:Skav212149  [mRNA]  locus=scaffold1323:334118:334732:- [translate_table: standard]